MLSAEFLDLLDEQLRKLVARFGRGPDNIHRGEKPSSVPPFGGVQLICCGDFFQLPPIPGRVPHETFGRLDQRLLRENRAVLRTGLDLRPQELYLNRGFAFQAASWWEASLVFVELSRVWRQKDAQLVGVLNRIRKGTMTPNDCRFLNSHCATLPNAQQRKQAAPAPQPPLRHYQQPFAAPLPLAAKSASASAGAATNASVAKARVLPAPRPMLLAPTNAVVNERNQKEHDGLREANARLGRPASIWMACDWAIVDEDIVENMSGEYEVRVHARPLLFPCLLSPPLPSSPLLSPPLPSSHVASQPILSLRPNPPQTPSIPSAPPHVSMSQSLRTTFVLVMFR